MAKQDVLIKKNDTKPEAITKRDITKSWITWDLGCEMSSSYERLQSVIFCAAMIPILKKLYKTKKTLSEALIRHLNFFNTEGVAGTIIHGVVIAMEEEKANGEDGTSDEASGEAITGIKTGLMGPLAGMGDSLIWSIWMPITIALFIPFAMQGSILGAIGPLVLYAGSCMSISYYLYHKGYYFGKESIITLMQNGKISELITGASVLGLFMMGALSASYVTITTPFTIKMANSSPIVIQKILDGIAPGILPLLAVFGIYFYMKKKGPRYTNILVAVLLISVLCSVLGIL